MTKEIAGTPWWERKVRDIYIYIFGIRIIPMCAFEFVNSVEIFVISRI
jgi:hypothetical protein